jgi:hypothetical protein
VAGWIKRGPSGGIGATKACARETVGALLEDATPAGCGPGSAGCAAAEPGPIRAGGWCA